MKLPSESDSLASGIIRPFGGLIGYKLRMQALKAVKPGLLAAK